MNRSNRSRSYSLLVTKFIPCFIFCFLMINISINTVDLESSTYDQARSFTGTPSTSPTRAQPVNWIVGKNIIQNITEDKVLGNLTIRDDGTVNIENCTFELQGMLKVSGNGRLFIKNSNVTISPGPVGPQDIIITLLDNAKVRIENSTIFTLPQPTPTNRSYLLSDDGSEVIIINSKLNCRLPKIVNLDIEITPPNAGTFVLTGDTDWNIRNCKIEAYLMYEDGMLVGRWFLFTPLGNSKLFMKDSNGFIYDESQPFIKPVGGFVKLENCNIPKGVIDVEVVAEFEAINLSIVDLNIRDQSKARVINSKISNKIDLGSVAITPSGTGDLDFTSNDEQPKASLYLENTIIEDTLIVQGNSSSTVINSTMDRCAISSTSNVHLIGCKVRKSIEARDNTSLFIENTSVIDLNIAHNPILVIHQNPNMSAISKITTGFNCQSTITLHSVKVQLFDLFGGDRVLPQDYGAGYEPDKNVSRIAINMKESEIKRIKIEDDSEILLTLDNSEIDEFTFTKIKNESVIMTILDINGSYPFPKPWPEVDLEILIYHRISISTLLNSKPISAHILVTDHTGKEIILRFGNDQGQADLDLHYALYSVNGESLIGQYSINLTYLGFSNIFKTTAEKSEYLTVNWNDFTPPKISNIKVDADFQRTHRGTMITAVIIDPDIKIVANATIFYQYRKSGASSWSDWVSSPMIEIKNNTFVGAIRQLPDGAEVRFYIEAYDIIGNRIESNKHTYTIEDVGSRLIMVVSVLLVIIFILLLFIILKGRAKINKYLNKPGNESTSEKHENK